MKRIFWGVGAAVAATVVLEGCMPDSLEVGRRPVEVGGGSGEAGDGTGGAQGGSSAAGNGGRAGSGAAADGGTAGSAGRGAAAGRGGSSRGGAGGGGGSGGTSGAGTAGAGGDSRISFDPACDCKAYIDDEFGEFDCVVPRALFDEHFSPPESCDEDIDYARQGSCEDGTTRYEWMVGNENRHELIFDGETLVYGYVSGYDLQPVCNFSFTQPNIFGQAGTLRTGPEPDAECSDECLLCSSDEPEIPWCAACVLVPELSFRAVTEPLETYCTKRPCPSTVDLARSSFEVSCPTVAMYPTITMRTGCGIISVHRNYGLGGTSYYYDATTLALVGALVMNDLPSGECGALQYRGGFIPTEACDTQTACDLCVSEDGAAGAGGAGESGGFAPCPP